MIAIHTDISLVRKTVLARATLTSEYSTELLDSVEQVFGEEISPETAVARVMEDVRVRGDDAVRDWSRRIDGVSPDPLEVPVQELEAAAHTLPSEVDRALRLAVDRIREFHSRQVVRSWSTSDLGGVLGQRVVPLARVGIYVPGGTAPLPSSLLMATIPAQVAGVREIVICTPPRGSGGNVPAVVLAAAHMLGIRHVLRVGGAQAIAALTFGTETVPRVDKIVGPGNLFVTLAKKQVFGQVGLDGIAGPTETMVVADESANPEWIAADLLAQAEHDILSIVILLTPSRWLAEEVKMAVERQIVSLSRAEIISKALHNRGGIVITPDLETAIDVANEFAPEHLCLSVSDSDRWSSEIRNAGGLFVNEHSCEVLGDYVAGPSHIMPTGGSARFASAGNVFDYVKIMSIFQLDEETSVRLSPVAETIARCEYLDGHATSAALRYEDGLPS